MPLLSLVVNHKQTRWQNAVAATAVRSPPSLSLSALLLPQAAYGLRTPTHVRTCTCICTPGILRLALATMYLVPCTSYDVQVHTGMYVVFVHTCSTVCLVPLCTSIEPSTGAQTRTSTQLLYVSCLLPWTHTVALGLAIITSSSAIPRTLYLVPCTSTL